MSAPGLKAFSPAPRKMTQRTDGSLLKARRWSRTPIHIALLSALSFSARLSTTRAISPWRSRRTASDIGVQAPRDRLGIGNRRRLEYATRETREDPDDQQRHAPQRHQRPARGGRRRQLLPYPPARKTLSPPLGRRLRFGPGPP